MFDSIKNWVKSALWFDDTPEVEKPQESLTGAGSNNMDIPSFSIPQNDLPLPNDIKQWLDENKKNEDNLILKNALDGKITRLDAQRAWLWDDVIKAIKWSNDQKLVDLWQVKKDDPNTATNEAWSMPETNVKWALQLASDSFWWIWDKFGKVWTDMKKAAWYDDTQQNRSELVEWFTKEENDKKVREESIKKQDINDNIETIQDEYNKNTIALKEFYAQNKTILDDYTADQQAWLDVVNMRKKYMKYGATLAEWNALRSKVSDWENAVKANEFKNLVNANMNLETPGMRKEYLEKVVKPLFLDSEWFKWRDAITYWATEAWNRFQSILLDEYTKAADAAIDAWLYNDRQSYFADKNVYTNIRLYTERYMNNLKNDSEWQKLLTYNDWRSGIDWRWINTFNESNDKQKQLYWDLSTQLFDEKKINSSAREEGFVNGKQDWLRAANGILKSILFDVSTLTETYNTKIRDKNIKESSVGGDLFASLKNRVTYDDTFWNEAWHMIANNPAESLYYTYAAATAFKTIWALSEINPATFAWTTSKNANTILQWLGRNAWGIASEFLVWLPLDLATTTSSWDWWLNAMLNSVWWLKLWKFAWNIDFVAKTLSNITDEFQRVEEFKKITWLNNVLDINLWWDYNSIKDSLKTYVTNIDWLNAKKNPAVAVLRDYKNYLDTITYDNVWQLWNIAGAMRWDKNIMSIWWSEIKNIDTAIVQGRKEVAALEAAWDVEWAIAKKQEMLDSVKKSMTDIIDWIQPSTLRKIWYQRQAIAITRWWFNSLVNRVSEYTKVDPNIVAWWLVSSLLDTRWSAWKKFLDYMWSILTKSNDIDSYKNIQKEASKILEDVDALKAAGEAAKKDPEKFVMSVGDVTKKSDTITEGKADTVAATDTNVGTKVQWTKARQTKTTRSVKSIVSETSSNDLKTASHGLFSNIKRVFSDISGSEWRNAVSESWSAQKMAFIKDYLKKTYDIDWKQWSMLEKAIYSLSNGANEDEYIPMLGKMLWDPKAWENVEKTIKNMDNMSRTLSWKTNEIIDVAEEDIADMYSILSPWIKKYLTKNNISSNSFIAQWLDNLFKFVTDNKVAFRNSKLPEKIEWLTSIFENDSGKKIVVSLSGNLVERISSFSKTIKKTPADMKNFSNDISVIFHELWHVSMESLESWLKKKISSSLDKIVREEWFIDSDVLLDLIWKDTYADRIDIYRQLYNDKKYSELSHEIFADKFQADLYDSIFDYEKYQERVLRNMGSMWIIPWSKARWAAAKIENMFKPILEWLKEFFNEIVNFSHMVIWKWNITETLTSINYAIIKWDMDLLKKWWDFVDNSITKETTLFKRELSELENRVSWYQWMNDEEKTLLQIGRSDYMNVAKSIFTGKWKPIINWSLLTQNGRAFMSELLDVSSFSPEQLKKYEEIVAASSEVASNSIKKATAVLVTKFYDDWAKILKTFSEWWSSLIDMLRWLPIRISEAKWSKASWGIIYDPWMTLMKYSLTSDYNSTRKILTDFYNSFFSKEELSSMSDVVWWFKKMIWVEDWQWAWDAVMKLYDDMRLKLMNFTYSNWDTLTEKQIDDILNPLIYNTNEYIYAIWNMKPETLAWQSKSVADYVLGKILKRRSDSMGRDIGELSELAQWSSEKNFFDFLNSWAWIRNYLTTKLWQWLSDFIKETQISLPINKDSLYEFLYKDIGFFDAGWDTQLLNYSMELAGKLNENITDASKLQKFIDILESEKYSWLFYNYDKDLSAQFLIDMNAALKSEWIDNSDINEILDVFSKYNSARAANESYNVIWDYFIDKILKSKIATDEIDAIDNWTKTIEDVLFDVQKNKEVIDDYYNSQKKLDNIASIVEDTSKKSLTTPSDNTKKLLATMGIDEDTAIALSDKIWIPVEELVNGDIAKERIFRWIFDDAMKGKMRFADILMQDDKLSQIISSSIDDWWKWIKWTEKYKVMEDWTIDKIIEPEKTFMWRFLMSTNTLANIANNDSETAQMLGRINKARQDMNMYKWKAKLPGIEWRTFIKGEYYIAAARKELQRLAHEAGKKAGILNIRKVDNSTLNEIYKNTLERWYTGKISIQGITRDLTTEESSFSKFIDDYLQDIAEMRNRLNLWEIRDSAGGIIADIRSQMVNPMSMGSMDKMINRMTWLWTYTKSSDISRFSEKYGKVDWKNFFNLDNMVADTFFRAAHDEMERIFFVEKPFGRYLRKYNKGTQKIWSFMLFNGIVAPYKFIQQIVSNTVWSSAQLALWWYNKPIYEDLYKLINDDLWFSVIRTAGKNDEFAWWDSLLKKASNYIVDKTISSKDIGSIVKDYLGVGWSLLVNSLPLWDQVTRKRAVLWAMTKAMLDDYSVWWEEFVKKFLKDVDSMNAWKIKTGVKDSDFFTPDKISKRIQSYVRKNTAWMKWLEKKKFTVNAEEEMRAYYAFHKEKYSSFINKTRDNLSAFFVTDNVSEFAWINVINNNKMAFGLMKWATGKTFESALNIYTAAQEAFVWKTSAMDKMKWIYDFVSSTAITELSKQLYYGTKIWWQVDKMTDWWFSTWYTAAIMAPALSAAMMLVGDAIYEWFWKEGVVWAELRWQNLREGIWVWLSKLSENLFNRASLYNAVVLSPIAKAKNTTLKLWKHTNDEIWESTFNTFFKVMFKDLVTDSLNRYATTSVQWVLTNTNNDGTTLENTLEYILNMDSNARRDQKRISGAWYDNFDNLANDETKSLTQLQGGIINSIPVIKELFWRDSVDYSFLIEAHDNFVQKSWINILLDKFATKSSDGKLSKVLDKIAHEQIINKDDNKKQILSWKASGTQYDESKMLSNAMIWANYEPFDFIVSWLQTDKKTGKIIRNTQDALLSKEDKDKVYRQLNELIAKYDKDWSATTRMDWDKFKEFVSNVTRTWSKASMAYLMKAYSSFARKALATKYWLKTADINEWEEWVDIESESKKYQSMNDSSSQAYQEYVLSNRNFQKSLLLQNRDLIAWEKHVLLDLQNDYLSKTEDYPFKNKQSNLWDSNTTYWAMIALHNMNEISKNEGIWNTMFNMYNMSIAKQVAAINKSNLDWDSVEWAKKMVDWIIKQVWEIDKAVVKQAKSGTEIIMHKIWQATMAAPGIEKIMQFSPEKAQELINTIGKDAFTLFVDRLTDSNPTDLVTAFEMLSGDSTNKKWWWAKWAMPKQPRALSMKEEKLLDNYNNLAITAAKYRDPNKPALPKFAISYETQTGRYIPVKIDVKPAFAELKSEQIRPKWQPAPNLSVWKAPVKQWRVLSSSARPKSIAGAKAYSRKAWSKGAGFR